MKHQGLLTIQENLQIAICFFFVAINSGEIPASVWQEKRSFKVLKRCYVRICPTGFFAVLWKAVNLQHMRNLDTTWSVTLGRPEID